MENTWIVVPVKDNAVDASDVVAKLTGGFVAPEKYEVRSMNFETKETEVEEVDHPYFGVEAPDFSGRIVFINFEEGHVEFDGVTHIADNGDINIYRAWNTGIDHAAANGADAVVLVNALTDFDPFTIVGAKEKLDEGGVEVVNISDGGMLMIAGSSAIRADEQFQIWYGDNDLYNTAKDVTVDHREVYGLFSHIEDWSSYEGFDEIVENDKLKYEAKIAE
jgi:hypothetical protein